MDDSMNDDAMTAGGMGAGALGDGAIAELVGRATEDPRGGFATEVRQRVLAEMSTPTDVSLGSATDPAGRTRAHRNWWFGLSAAAVIALVVAGLVVTTGRDDDNVSTTASDPGTPFLLPTVWRSDMAEVQTETLETRGATEQILTTSALLAHRGTAEVAVVGTGVPIPDMPLGEDGPIGERFPLSDGREAMYLEDGDGTMLWIEIADDSSAYLTATDVPRATLERLAQAVGGPDGVAPEQLPADWAVVDDPTGVLALTLGGLPEPTSVWYMATRYTGGGSQPNRSIGLLTSEVDDAPGAVEEAAALSGARARRLEFSTGGHGYWIEPIGRGTPTLVWAPSAAVVAMIGGTDVSEEERLDLAVSVEPITEQEWLALGAQTSGPDVTSGVERPEQAPTTTTVAADGP